MRAEWVLAFICLMFGGLIYRIVCLFIVLKYPQFIDHPMLGTFAFACLIFTGFHLYRKAS